MVSVIVVNWKVPQLLRLCLASVFEHTRLPASEFEVIVVDNASGDGSVELVVSEFPQVKLVANSANVGFGAANNQALPLCRGELVLLLNPDTLLLDDAIGALAAAMKARPDVAVIGCRLLNGDGTLQKWTGGAFPTLWNVACHYLFLDRVLPAAWRSPLYLDRDAGHDMDVGWVSGACMMLRRSALGTTLFDEAYFMYGEDMELCHRLRGAGWRVVYTPAVSIVHYQGASMKQQQGDIMLSSIKGPRQFFRQTHRDSPVWLFDALTVAGFVLRWAMYGAARWVTGRARYAEKASSSRHYLGVAWRLMTAATRQG